MISTFVLSLTNASRRASSALRPRSYWKYTALLYMQVIPSISLSLSSRLPLVLRLVPSSRLKSTKAGYVAVNLHPLQLSSHTLATPDASSNPGSIASLSRSCAWLLQRRRARHFSAWLSSARHPNRRAAARAQPAARRSRTPPPRRLLRWAAASTRALQRSSRARPAAPP